MFLVCDQLVLLRNNIAVSLTCPFSVLDAQRCPVGREERQQVGNASLRDLPEGVAQQHQHGHEADDGEPDHDGFGHRAVRVVEPRENFGRRFGRVG